MRSYDQSGPSIKKQRHSFSNKGLSSQGYGFSSSHVWMWESDYKKSSAPKNGTFELGPLGRLLRVLWSAKRSHQLIQRKSVLNIHWKDWCWSWSSNALATCCEELTHWKRPWCWERSKAGGEGDDRGWDGWMTSSTQWTWIWANSRRQWRTGEPSVLQSMGSQRAGHDLATKEQ